MLNNVNITLLFCIVLQVLSNSSKAETVVSFGNKYAVEEHYQYRALILALDKTVAEHGTYKMNLIKSNMNARRAKVEILKDSYPNLVIASGGNTQEFEQYSYAPFPIELGLLGYRLPIHHVSKTKLYSTFSTLKQLNKLRIVQGQGWFDSKILKDNGFLNVVEIKDQNFGKMLLLKRVDLYFSSLSDVNTHLNDSIKLNDSFGLYYHSPRFYISNKSNKEVIERIYQGLVKASTDGSLQNLMETHFSTALSKLKLENRKVLRLENGQLKGIDKRYFQWTNELEKLLPHIKLGKK